MVQYLSKFIYKYLAPITILLLCTALISAFFLMAIFGLYLFGFENYIHSCLVAILIFTRGTINPNYEHRNLTETNVYLFHRVPPLLLFITVIPVGYIIRYFMINLSVASLMTEIHTARENMKKEKQRKKEAEEEAKQKKEEEEG